MKHNMRMKRKHTGDPPHDDGGDSDLRPCPMPSDAYVCDLCCGMSVQRNKFLWIVKIPWVAPIGTPPWVASPWVGLPGGCGWRLVDRDELSTNFVKRNKESTKYVCFLCAGTFVYGDREEFMVNDITGCAVGNLLYPCCVSPNYGWRYHGQQAEVHLVPNLKKNRFARVCAESAPRDAGPPREA